MHAFIEFIHICTQRDLSQNLLHLDVKSRPRWSGAGTAPHLGDTWASCVSNMSSFVMISPWFVYWELWGILFLSAEDSSTCWETCNEEEPQEASNSPPRHGPGKEEGLSALGCRVSGVWPQSWTAWPLWGEMCYFMLQSIRTKERQRFFLHTFYASLHQRLNIVIFALWHPLFSVKK